MTLDEKILVVNKYKLPVGNSHTSIYIGRGSPFGNPFTVDKYGRDGACDKFDMYMEEQLASNKPNPLKSGLYHLVDYVKHSQEPVMLVCFCAPKRCHGEAIKRHIINQLENNYETSY